MLLPECLIVFALSRKGFFPLLQAENNKRDDRKTNRDGTFKK